MLDPVALVGVELVVFLTTGFGTFASFGTGAEHDPRIRKIASCSACVTHTPYLALTSTWRET